MAQAGVANRSAGRMTAERARRIREARINQTMLKLTMALIVVCLFGYIGRMTVISAGAKEISRVREEISKLHEEQQYLEVQLAAQQNPARIRDEATGRLGMSYPKDGQVYLISLGGYASGANTQTAHENAAP